MRKYLFRYLFFWFPAAVVAYFFSMSTLPSHIAQWVTMFFMLFGWSVNTGMAAYRYPRSTLSALLAYAGFSTLIIVVMYMTDPRDGLGIVLRYVGGLLSFKPMQILVYSVMPLTEQPPELVVLGVLLACCLTGYLIGLVQRRIHPDPYSPRIRR